SLSLPASATKSSSSSLPSSSSSKNNFRLKPGSFEGFQTSGLYLQECDLDRLDYSIFASIRPSLKYLWLTGNKLRHIHENFSSLFEGKMVVETPNMVDFQWRHFDDPYRLAVPAVELEPSALRLPTAVATRAGREEGPDIQRYNSALVQFRCYDVIADSNNRHSSVSSCVE
ncbi:hypothetical protein HELRODRAFT_184560, partial [Helobdella robusta]|uniref:Uncharacterized protein n=1 Tax=Helobdella robusta TaxID=6412 RepID=T1FLH1_HELRO